MTPNALVDTYLAHIGMRRVAGDGYDAIMPFFMLDAMYQILAKDISPIPCKQEQKLILKRWKGAYNSFNRDFFSAFSQEQQDEIIDMMDDFQEFINNDIIIAKVAVMNQLKPLGLTFEQQKIVASCMVCHVLAQTAQITWGAIYKNRWGEDKVNPYIKAIAKYSYEWMNMYFSKITDAYVNPNDSEPICTAMDLLCKKMVKFLKQVRAA